MEIMKPCDKANIIQFLTAQLVFAIFMLAVGFLRPLSSYPKANCSPQAEKHKGTYLAPVGIGLALFICELAGVYYTGGSLNPARSFGPCVANRTFPNEHWIYWLGPFLGALVASGFFWFIKSCEYEAANPGQDFDDLEADAFNPDQDLSRPVVSPNAVVDRSLSREMAERNSTQERPNSSGPPPRITSNLSESPSRTPRL